MKKQIPGTSFSVRKDVNNLPDAIMWMTPHMKENAVRYGDILFLSKTKFIKYF